MRVVGRSIAEWTTLVGEWRRSKKFQTPTGLEMPVQREMMLGKLMLVVTEVAEAAEAVRKADRENFAEEIADTVIRLFDIAEACGINLEKVMEDKMAINRERSALHGKQVRL